MAAIVAFLIAAASRLLAISHSLWDADEARFALALRDFDVADHQPHPPGFPLFIALGRVVHATGVSEFRSLQIVVVAAAVLLAPAMFLMCRELRAGFSMSIAASLVLVFLPNVWFYSGTAFSDVPALTLLLVASALILRGCRDSRALYGGAIVLGLAASVRPQNLLLGVIPLLLALVMQKRRAHSIPVILVLLAMLAGSYGWAARATGWARYVDALRAHRDYIAATDSFRSAIRPPLYRLVDDFFVRPFRAPLLNAALCALIAASLIRAVRRTRVQPVLLLVAYAPFCVLAWLTLDHFSASRFSIAYAPLFAYLAADGLNSITVTRPRLESAGLFALIGAMWIWIWPALSEVRRTSSPPVRAVEWVRAQSSPGLRVAVDSHLDAHAKLLMPDLQRSADAGALTSPWRTRERVMVLREEIPAGFRGQTFSRQRGRLWWLARQRYFDIAAVHADPVLFGEGWYAEESVGSDVWRWMGPRGTIALPPPSGEPRLTLNFRVPVHEPREPATIIIRLNGVHIDSFRAQPTESRSYEVTPRPGIPNLLEIETSVVGRAPGDERPLGLRLEDLQWSWPRDVR